MDQQKQIASNLIDCGDELKTILHENGICPEDGFIDFNRDKDLIKSEYNDAYINFYSKARIGQTVFSESAKQNMTVIAYRSSEDIDVQFEDGSIRQGVRWDCFKEGRICLPSLSREGQRSARIGETRLMSNGMNAKIIRYKNATDIDVEFEDGEIAKGKTYKNFRCGYVAHPNKVSTKALLLEKASA